MGSLKHFPKITLDFYFWMMYEENEWGHLWGDDLTEILFVMIVPRSLNLLFLSSRVALSEILLGRRDHSLRTQSAKPTIKGFIHSAQLLAILNRLMEVNYESEPAANHEDPEGNYTE
jgi:ABC-type enterochelin transport system permease subunit